MSLVVLPLILFCDNCGVVAQSKEPRNHQKGKHIERKYHLICEILMTGDVVVEKIVVDPQFCPLALACILGVSPAPNPCMSRP